MIDAVSGDRRLWAVDADSLRRRCCSRVDTKKRELVGDYANGGSEWTPENEPER